jgi:hypothetical protein
MSIAPSPSGVHEAVSVQRYRPRADIKLILDTAETEAVGLPPVAATLERAGLDGPRRSRLRRLKRAARNERAAAGTAPIRSRCPRTRPRREWTLVCDSRDYPACVTDWEILLGGRRAPTRAGASR